MGSGTSPELLSGLALVAVGSALGGLARFLLSEWIERRIAGEWPVATLLVNLSGAFLIGLLSRFGAMIIGAQDSVFALFFATGFLGSYTTVSAFSLQMLILVQRRRLRQALLYLLLTLVGGLAACAAGFLAAGLWA